MDKHQVFISYSRKDKVIAERIESELTSRGISCFFDPSETDLDLFVNGVWFNMIKVEGGSFDMGATPEQGADVTPWENPVHQVTLSDYYIGETEVTQELWKAVMGSNPSEYAGNPKNPVETVSWYDVVNDFLPKLNALTGRVFTLPTEAQWEFAARGGNKSKGYKYSGSNNLNEVVCPGVVSRPVGQRLPNELGLYDMTGNVYEWCLDWNGDYAAEAQTNPTGPASGMYRMVRGGCSCSFPMEFPVSHRSMTSPKSRTCYIGFRLVLVM